MATGLFNLKQVNQAISQGAWSGYIAPRWVEYLVVAGGGGGGVETTSSGTGGGGGAGGLLTGIVNVTAGTSYTVTVGAGGATRTSSGVGNNGVASVFGNISATGGGGGGGTNGGGASGGSGGGASYSTYPTFGDGIVGQGNAGGFGKTGTGAGGGGGAGTVGLSGSTTAGSSVGNNGGAGIASAISGTVTAYAGGGGGTSYGTAGVGGVGGGGTSGIANSSSGTSGGGNTGGGGGGGGNSANGMSGGSGIVVVRYPGSIQFFTGGTLSYANGYIIHTFFANGTLAPTTPTPYVTDYQISRSLRFNSADTTYLNRTPATATNRRTWTWSGWVKKGIGARSLFTSFWASTDAGYFNIIFNSEVLAVQTWAIDVRVTTQVFRDPSAWYHIVVALDTTQASNIDRIKIYVNGVQITAFTSTGTIAQNTELAVNYNGVHYIGSLSTTQAFFDGYMTEVNFVDGQALTPTSFGYVNPATGVWSPLKFVGTYGTNGFYLNFSDNSNTTAATLGADYSGNGNNWTPNNFSVTAGAGNDSMVDSPTSYGTDTGVGGTVRGNYATLNPISLAGGTFTNGNLDWAAPTTDGRFCLATIPVNFMNCYCEVTIGSATSLQQVGVYGNPTTFNPRVQYRSDGQASVDGTTIATYATFTTNDIIGIAYNSSTGSTSFYKNGTLQGSMTATSATVTQYFAAGSNNSGATANYTFNFGQRPFAYTAPSGFKALCTQNLPTPTIGATTATLANKYFDATLYTGTGSTLAVTNAGGFQPDWVWLKNRSNTAYHSIWDAVRGRSAGGLASNDTGAEQASTAGNDFVSFNSNGFSVGPAQNWNVDTNGNTYVGWQWKANGSGSTNTAGSITSTVSANTTSGFSIVNWTGSTSTSSQTVGHGLGVTPSVVILKDRSTVDNWFVYFSGTTSVDQYLRLNSTASLITSGSNVWGAGMTSTLVGVRPGTFAGSTSDNIIMYCFAPIAGFSAFGSYTGNSSTDGTFVYLGFRPAYMMIKATNAVEDWVIMDVARSPYNGVNLWLNAEDTSADATLTPPQFDFNSNGMKLRGTSSTVNATGTTYIYMAFASNPFKTSLAR